MKNVPPLQTNFLAATPELRRAALLPFFWAKLPRKGSSTATRRQGSVATVTNGKKFSYPGYSEIAHGLR